MLRYRRMITVLDGDCREVLPSLPGKSVQCAITSPPYWMQRSYLPDDHPAKEREIGREPTVAAYIETLVGVFRQVARVLMNDGTLWLNIWRPIRHEHAGRAASRRGFCHTISARACQPSAC